MTQSTIIPVPVSTAAERRPRRGARAVLAAIGLTGALAAGGLGLSGTAWAEQPAQGHLLPEGWCWHNHGSNSGCHGGSLDPFSKGPKKPPAPIGPQTLHSDGSVTDSPPDPNSCSSYSSICYGDPPRTSCPLAGCTTCDWESDCAKWGTPDTESPDTPEKEPSEISGE